MAESPPSNNKNDTNNTNDTNDNTLNDSIKETANFATPKRTSNKQNGSNTRKNRYNNFMKATTSFLNKQRAKYEATIVYPKMSFSMATDTLTRSTPTPTSTILRRSYQWNDSRVFEDTLNHFTNDNYGSDPYNHFD